ncbi:MAG TPA: aminotransferase class V-fold PLP-dependent enzyme [Vicinamibacteria bacterium]|nr:aminotransferase class V-fold PLP-dependent enzyme [Vicinamibacteria bacterium]
MAIPWEEVRKDFPAAERRVYLNAAATGLTPPTVRQAVDRFYRELEEGGDAHWDDWMRRREEVRAKVASLIGAEAEEIAFVPNTSTGMNLIVDLLAADGPVLSDELEFPAVTLPWIHRGVPVSFMPAVEGIIRLESFMKPDAPRAATIAISHVQFSNGCRQDLDAFGLLKDDRHLVVSASQSAGVIPIDVRRSRIDALASAGHKWLGAGYGAGFVYVRGGLLVDRPPRAIGWMSVESPFSFDNRQYKVLPGHRRAEMGCPDFGPIFALGAAVDYVRGLGIEAIVERVLQLGTYLRGQLEREGIAVLSPPDPYRSAQTLCAVEDPPGAAAFLRERGIEVTVKPEGVRISTHYYNSEQDVDTCVAALAEYVRSFPPSA